MRKMIVVCLKNSKTQISVDNNEFASSYSLKVYNDDSDAELLNKNELLILDLDKPLNVKFVNIGLARKVVLKIFYDYNEMFFNVNGDSMNFENKYVFDVKDNEEVIIPVYLKNLIEDDFSHKLIVSFIVGYDRHASDLSDISNYYGIHSIYDLNFDSERSLGFKVQNRENISLPNYTFDFYSQYLVLNMDYENAEQKNNTLKFPDKVMSCRKNDEIKLMYNISNTNNKEAILFLLVDFNQISVDGMAYKLIKLSKDSVSNGEIKFITPNKPGLYDVIGYVVFDPYDKLSYETFVVRTSYRFTLKVE